jgi:hypothetical protein
LSGRPLFDTDRALKKQRTTMEPMRCSAIVWLEKTLSCLSSISGTWTLLWKILAGFFPRVGVSAFLFPHEVEKCPSSVVFTETSLNRHPLDQWVHWRIHPYRWELVWSVEPVVFFWSKINMQNLPAQYYTRKQMSDLTCFGACERVGGWDSGSRLCFGFYRLFKPERREGSNLLCSVVSSASVQTGA